MALFLTVSAGGSKNKMLLHSLHFNAEYLTFLIPLDFLEVEMNTNNYLLLIARDLTGINYVLLGP